MSKYSYFDCEEFVMNQITARPNFRVFYRGDYAADHRHPVNLALHAFGTITGIALLAATALGTITAWWALAFPIVHVGPGLIGHRFFDRDEAIGDIRLLRTDYPLWWFLIANHIMTAGLLVGRRP
jgi:hypothetical protein